MVQISFSIASLLKVLCVSQVNFIYIAQYQKSQFCLKGLYHLYRAEHPPSLDPQFG